MHISGVDIWGAQGIWQTTFGSQYSLSHPCVRLGKGDPSPTPRGANSYLSYLLQPLHLSSPRIKSMRSRSDGCLRQPSLKESGRLLLGRGRMPPVGVLRHYACLLRGYLGGKYLADLETVDRASKPCQKQFRAREFQELPTTRRKICPFK